jgi:hypothetical protein
MAKKRTSVPTSIAAETLFSADRICCVCRITGKPIQIHHIDDDPSNHDASNLAVLCLECHDETQRKGGFTRRLDEEQVQLYRDSWIRIVAARRSVSAEDDLRTEPSIDAIDADIATSIVEINKEAGNHANLAMFYDSIGNKELRDKSIEAAINQGISGTTLIRLRRIQGRLKDVPGDIIDAEIVDAGEESEFGVAGIYEDLSEHRRAAEAYVNGLSRWLGGLEDFTLAFCLKRLAETNITSGLFLNALQQSADEGDLWWQVRALEELEWTSELHALVKEHRDEIDSSNLNDEQRCRLQMILAEAIEDHDGLHDARLEYEKIRASVKYR